MDFEEIIAKATAAAKAAAEEAAQKAEKAKKREAASAADTAAAKRAAAQEKAKGLLEAARAKEVKQGLDLAEEVLRDISPNILRFLTREDADRLLNSGVRLTIHFSKTDDSGTIPSFSIQRSGAAKMTRTIHRASIEQWAASESMFLERYRRDGGNPSISSYHELMLELIRLNKENDRLRLLLERHGQEMLARTEAPMVPGSTETSPTIIEPTAVAPGNVAPESGVSLS